MHEEKFLQYSFRSWMILGRLYRTGVDTQLTETPQKPMCPPCPTYQLWPFSSAKENHPKMPIWDPQNECPAIPWIGLCLGVPFFFLETPNFLELPAFPWRGFLGKMIGHPQTCVYPDVCLRIAHVSGKIPPPGQGVWQTHNVSAPFAAGNL